MLAGWRSRLSSRSSPDAGAASVAAGLPSLCAICHGWGRGRVCGTCIDRFSPRVERCSRCALPVAATVRVCGTCLAAPPSFDASIACVDYAAPWDRLVTAFKFHAALDLAPVFARAIANAAGAAEAPLPDLLLPVPLAAARLRERGYNQAWELARRTGQQLGIPAHASMLVRIRDTLHQLSLPPAARAGNVHGAFAVEPARRREVAGRSIAVVDDVMTTGSTAATIASVLKQAGAAQVSIWVYARTPRPGE
jgi:ComF family protein